MSEEITRIIERRAGEKHLRLGIGAGSERKDYLKKILQAVEKVDFAEVIIVSNVKSVKGEFEVYTSDKVESDLVRMLRDGSVDAVVRGTCRANLFLSEIKRQFNRDKVGRLALLKTPFGHEFFFAPVGIDEGNSLADKVFLINEGIGIAEKLGVNLRIGVLSGGRRSDVGRHNIVDRSIIQAKELVGHIKGHGHKEIKNYNILIEDAIADGANFIIAPDGISGNLIFRTLTFLGQGRGLGAFYVGINETIVDTSRAGTPEDYLIAMMMACSRHN
jgi:putative methanogen marker protein 4